MQFNIYMKPLGALIQRFGVQCHQYVESMHSHVSIPSESGGAVKVLDRWMEAAMDCMGANKLKRNHHDSHGAMPAYHSDTQSRPYGSPGAEQGVVSSCGGRNVPIPRSFSDEI